MVRRMLAPIMAIKHYTHRSNTTVATGATSANNLVDAIAAPGTANSFSVTNGAVVKAVYLELWAKSNSSSGASNSFTFIIEKKPADATAITVGQLVNLGGYPNKKNILYAAQGNVGDLTTASVAIFKGWIMIPKGKQRFGLGDKLLYNFFALGATFDICGISTFKEYT